MANTITVVPIKKLDFLYRKQGHWNQMLLPNQVMKYTAKNSPYSKVKVNGINMAVPYNKTVYVIHSYAHIHVL